MLISLTFVRWGYNLEYFKSLSTFVLAFQLAFNNLEQAWMKTFQQQYPPPQQGRQDPRQRRERLRRRCGGSPHRSPPGWKGEISTWTVLTWESFLQPCSWENVSVVSLAWFKSFAKAFEGGERGARGKESSALRVDVSLQKMLLFDFYRHFCESSAAPDFFL